MADRNVPTRRHDPQRRDRIIDACLDVIAEHGVKGASHRQIAKAADVPLGSMTYHFAGMDELLREAFTRFMGFYTERFDTRMRTATSPQDAADAVVSMIERDVFASQRELVITHELYTLAARDPAYRELTDTWMSRSRTSLERHFDPITARLLDAIIEGLTIHEALDTRPGHKDLARIAVQRLTTTNENDIP